MKKYIAIVDGEIVREFKTLVPLKPRQIINVLREYAAQMGIGAAEVTILPAPEKHEAAT